MRMQVFKVILEDDSKAWEVIETIGSYTGPPQTVVTFYKRTNSSFHHDKEEQITGPVKIKWRIFKGSPPRTEGDPERPQAQS